MGDGQSHGFQNQNGLIWDALRVPSFQDTSILHVYVYIYIWKESNGLLFMEEGFRTHHIMELLLHSQWNRLNFIAALCHECINII